MKKNETHVSGSSIRLGYFTGWAANKRSIIQERIGPPQDSPSQSISKNLTPFFLYLSLLAPEKSLKIDKI